MEWRKWEHTRVIAYTMASTVPSKKRLPKMTKWMPLPTDRETEMGEDKVKDLFKKLKEHDRRKST